MNYWRWRHTGVAPRRVFNYGDFIFPSAAFVPHDKQGIVLLFSLRFGFYLRGENHCELSKTMRLLLWKPYVRVLLAGKGVDERCMRTVAHVHWSASIFNFEFEFLRSKCHLRWLSWNQTAVIGSRRAYRRLSGLLGWVKLAPDWWRWDVMFFCSHAEVDLKMDQRDGVGCL